MDFGRRLGPPDLPLHHHLSPVDSYLIQQMTHAALLATANCLSHHSFGRRMKAKQSQRVRSMHSLFDHFRECGDDRRSNRSSVDLLHLILLCVT